MTSIPYNISQQITSVRLVATFNLTGSYFNGSLNNGIGSTLSSFSLGSLILDGVQVNQNDRILLPSQFNANENGIYIVNSVGSSNSIWILERSPDFQSLEQLIPGQFFTVNAGNKFGGNLFVLTEPLPSQIGSGLIGLNFIDVGNAGSAGPYLTVANNLSDVNNKMTSFSNLGFGSGQSVTLLDSDFTLGVHQLSNPCPNFVTIIKSSPGILRLPQAQGSQAFIPSMGPVISVIPISSSISIQLSDGTPFISGRSPMGVKTILTDNSTLVGSWDAKFEVEQVNEMSGTIKLNNGIQNIYVANSGSDTGDGSVVSPYKTLSHAISSILSASSSTPYSINLATGVYNETNLNIKPWIFINGNNSQLNISSSVTLDSSWSTSGGTSIISGFNNLVFPSTITLDFSLITSLVSFVIKECFVGSNSTINFIGNHSGFSNLILNRVLGEFAQFTYNIQDFYIDILNSESNGISISNTGGSQNVNLFNLTNFNDFSCSISNDMILYHENSKSLGNTIYSTTGSGNLQVFSKGMTYSGTLTLNNGTSGGHVIFSSDFLDQIPTLLNGATYSPTSLGNSIKSNFNPLNYVPVDPSVTGHLEGIDNALTTGVSPSLNDVYNNGADANIGLESNRPISFQEITESSGAEAVSSPSSGSNTVANFRVLGWTFTVNSVLTITALQYNDNLFTQSGNRQTGIFDKSTGTLLAEVFISKTDSLNSGYRTHNLSTPINVYPGIQYVFATVVAANETNHLNADATMSVDVNATQYATGASSSSLISLSFPTSFTNSANTIYIGNFIYNSDTVNEQININDNSSSINTIFDVISTVRGTRPCPVMTMAQRNIIPSPEIGLTIYNSDSLTFDTFDGSVWNHNTLSTSIITSSSVLMVPNTIYITNNASLVTLTLPTSAKAGTELRVLGQGSGGWTVAQNSGQSVILGNRTSTVGTGGNISSTSQSDCAIFSCQVANTTWIVYGVQGDLDVI